MKSAAETASEPRPAVSPTEKSGPNRSLRWCEFGLCMAITCFIVACHIVFWSHRGGLWRDEVQIVNISLSPTFSEFWRDLAIDTFPALWPAAVKCWTMICGDSDGSLRVLGLLIGLAVLASVWYAVWQVGGGFPVLALALFALCPTVIRYGDAVRGYGLGLVFLLIMYARIWKAAAAPTLRNVLLGMLAALAAVQAMYFSAALLPALGAASAAIGLRRRTWKPALAAAGTGLPAAVSLLIYADPILRQNQWHDVMRFELSLPWVAQKVCEATNTAGRLSIYVWLGVTVLVVAAATHAVARGPRGRDAVVFASVAIVAGIACYLAFIFGVSQRTNTWYYTPLMAFLAVSFDAAFAAGRFGRLFRLCGAALLVLLTAPTVWIACQARMTNVDLIARTLEEKAREDDLIVVMPWWPGVTFERYYHGKAPWTTLPDFGRLRVQRYDLLQQRMAEPEPIRPVLENIMAALRGGHRLWLVGGLAQSRSHPGEVMRLSEAPRNVQQGAGGRRNSTSYQTVWCEQMTYVILHHSRRGEVVGAGAGEQVSEFEKPTLFLFQGWQ